MPQINKQPYEEMPEIIISPAGVEKLLQSIDPSKATGPDNISNQALKIAAVEFSPNTLFHFPAINRHWEYAC